MNLKTELSPPIFNPIASDIHRLITDDQARGCFIILSQTDENYMQAAGEKEPFILEYRDTSEEQNYQCLRRISRAELEMAFLKYLDGDTSWKTDFSWKKININSWEKYFIPGMGLFFLALSIIWNLFVTKKHP